MSLFSGGSESQLVRRPRWKTSVYACGVQAASVTCWATSDRGGAGRGGHVRVPPGARSAPRTPAQGGAKRTRAMPSKGAKRSPHIAAGRGGHLRMPPAEREALAAHLAGRGDTCARRRQGTKHGRPRRTVTRYGGASGACACCQSGVQQSASPWRDGTCGRSPQAGGGPHRAPSRDGGHGCVQRERERERDGEKKR